MKNFDISNTMIKSLEKPSCALKKPTATAKKIIFMVNVYFFIVQVTAKWFWTMPWTRLQKLGFFFVLLIVFFEFSYERKLMLSLWSALLVAISLLLSILDSWWWMVKTALMVWHFKSDCFLLYLRVTSSHVCFCLRGGDSSCFALILFRIFCFS